MLILEKVHKKIALKMILIGDSGVGKTSLMHWFVEHKFNGRYRATVGVDFLTKKVILSDEHCATIQIWDTAGQERYQGLGKAFYRGVDCCILVYDITDPVSFRNLEFWYQDFMTLNDSTLEKDFPFVVIGNKADSASLRKVPVSVAEDWCRLKNNLAYFETNVNDGINVDEAFDAAISLAYAKIKFLYEDYVVYEAIKFSKDNNYSPTKCIASQAKICGC